MAAQEGSLVHEAAEGRAGGRDDPGIVIESGEPFEQGFVFKQGEVVEEGVATVHEAANAALAEVGDEAGIFRPVEGAIVAAAQGRDGNHTGAVLGSDRAGFHLFAGGGP